MHLALVSTYYYPRRHGGTEHSLQLLCEALVARGHRVSMLSLHDGAEPERFIHQGVECHALPAPNLRQCLARPARSSPVARALWHVLDVYNPVAGRLLERELRALKPDVVHTSNLPGWSCAAWDAVRRCQLPHVQVLHDYQLTCPVATRFRNGCNCERTCASCAPFARIRQRASQRVRTVVANSRFTRDLHQRLGFFARAGRFEVIYGAVPDFPFEPPPAVSPRLRVGYIGRLHPTKGVETLLHAFRAVPRRDWVLRIAGSGASPYVEELRERGGDAPIEWLGHVPTASFLGSVDVLVVPSLWHEPMGRVVIEAAMAGVPVLAARRGGIPELVKPGLTGWLFDPERPEELSRQLASLAADEVRAMRPACRQWGEEFSTDVIAARWAALYSDLAAGRAVPELATAA